MTAIAQFNQLGGKTVSRYVLMSLMTKAFDEQSFEVHKRIIAVLDAYPNATDFTLEIDEPIQQINIGLGVPSIDELEVFEIKNGFLYKIGDTNVATVNDKGVITWHKTKLSTEIRKAIRKKAIVVTGSLGAARHSGLEEEGLDECGRLNPGYKYLAGGVIVKTGGVQMSRIVKGREVKPPTPKAKKPVNTAKKPVSNIQKKAKESNDPIGFMLVDFISGKTVASKKTLSELEKAYYSLEKNKAFEDSDLLVYEVIKKDGKNIKGTKINVTWGNDTKKKVTASNYGKKRKFVSRSEKYPFSKEDIPYETAYRAYTGTSFTPEKRATEEQRSYFAFMKEVYDENLKKATQVNKVAEFEKYFERFKAGYLKRTLDYLRSKSGIYSSMIAGPANFPVRQMEKKNNAANNKLNELLEYSKKAQSIFLDIVTPEAKKAIKTGSSSALENLEIKLKEAEAIHERGLAGNKLLKKLRANKEATEQTYVDAFIELGFDLATAKKEAAYMFKYTYAGFSTTNSGAKLRRLKEQISLENKLKEKAKKMDQGDTPEILFDGGSIKNDFSDNRIKIFFDAIPSTEIRSFLKKGGQAFKWSPFNKAWQRQLNTYYSGSRVDLYNYLGVKEQKPKEEKKKLVSKKAVSNIESVPLSKINIDKKRFQNRSKLNETVLKNIVDNFNETELDPLIIWNDQKDKKTYLLAGHHRFEALSILKKKTAPVKYFSGNEAKAIEFAKVKSNANRSLETPTERATIYRDLVGKKSKSEIEAMAKNIEGKNASYVLNLAALKSDGIVIKTVWTTSDADKQNATLVEKIADWIGQARRNYDLLTDAHEKEMFDFLMNKEDSKRIKTKADFLQKIYAIAGAFDFEKSKPLNLKRFKYQTVGEKEYDQEYSDNKKLLEQAIEEKAELMARLTDPKRIDFILANDVSANNAAADKLGRLMARIQFYQEKLIELSRKKGVYVKGGDNQIGLFSPNIIPLQPEPVQAKQIVNQGDAIQVKEQPKKANKLMQMEFDSLEMDEGWQELMQDPAKNMKIAIWGPPKNGKTSAALQFANYLTKFGTVLYNFADQGFNKSTQDLWKESGLVDKENAHPSDISSTVELEKELHTGKYNFCFIDMISDYIRTENLKPEEFKQRFVRQFPNVSFILIFEVTKGGNFKGDQGWTHLVDAIMTVENFLIENRGRYGMGEKIVWEEGFAKFNPKRYAEWKETQEDKELEFNQEVEKI